MAAMAKNSGTMSRIAFVTMVALSMLVVACGAPQRSVDMHDTQHDTWSVTEEFYYDNVDSLTKRDIAIAVRYSNGYVADSVAMNILCISPDSLVVEEPFTLHIPHIGDIRPEEQTFLYRRNVVLTTKGRYIFRLTPQSAVEGISSVGVVINDSHNND